MFGAVDAERLRAAPPSAAPDFSHARDFRVGGRVVRWVRPRQWTGAELDVHMIGIAATVGVAMYVIIELEYPRLGLVRIDAMDQAPYTEVCATMR